MLQRNRCGFIGTLRRTMRDLAGHLLRATQPLVSVSREPHDRWAFVLWRPQAHRPVERAGSTRQGVPRPRFHQAGTAILRGFLPFPGAEALTVAPPGSTWLHRLLLCQAAALQIEPTVRPKHPRQESGLSRAWVGSCASRATQHEPDNHGAVGTEPRNHRGWRPMFTSTSATPNRMQRAPALPPQEMGGSISLSSNLLPERRSRNPPVPRFTRSDTPGSNCRVCLDPAKSRRHEAGGRTPRRR